MACPLCKSKQFYVKDAEDEYETYEFETDDGDIRFADADASQEIESDQEIFCSRCSWHGRLGEIH